MAEPLQIMDSGFAPQGHMTSLQQCNDHHWISDSSPVVFTLPITPCALLGKGCERRLWTSHPVTQKSTSQSLTRFSVQAKSTYLPRSIISPSWTTRIWSAFIIVDNLQLLQKEDCKWLFGNWLLGVQTSPFETENLAQHCQPVRV